jgi:hypothetical protein
LILLSFRVRKQLLNSPTNTKHLFRVDGMQKIVLASQDVRLLETRGAVLEKTGAEVVCCFGEQASDAVTSRTPDLLVICHTIEHKEAEVIADMVHACCPKESLHKFCIRVLID